MNLTCAATAYSQVSGSEAWSLDGYNQLTSITNSRIECQNYNNCMPYKHI